MPTKGVAKAVAVLQAEKCHKSDVHEEESADWVGNVQGEKQPYDALMKMKSIKMPCCYSEEHGCIPVLQTRSLLGCHTCYKATNISLMYNHSRACDVKC
jgi:hypothetical protein